MALVLAFGAQGGGGGVPVPQHASAGDVMKEWFHVVGFCWKRLGCHTCPCG
jgi:hypothetical protein